MIPPLVSFITWNRMGLTVRNLTALLATEDDFELHIVDNNSKDHTWEYLSDLRDGRIVSKIRFGANLGQIYALNYNLSKRKKDQFFITVDNDVNIHTRNWISKFMEAFGAFPEVGLLGAVSRECFSLFKLPLLEKRKGNIRYLQLQKGFVEGCCQCLSPEVINCIGYWNEETCLGDMEICHRIASYTPYKLGFLPSVEIDQLQSISCGECPGKPWCGLDREHNCFSLHNDLYSNHKFYRTYEWKYKKYKKEMKKGIKTAFCASVSDEASIVEHSYDRHSAEENFRFYIENGN